MAGSISASVSLSGTGNSTNFTLPSVTETMTVSFATDLLDEGVQSIPTSNTFLNVNNVTASPGLLWLKNLDATNFITYGSTLALEFQLDPGEWAVQRVQTVLTTTKLVFKADTAACKLAYKLFSD